MSTRSRLVVNHFAPMLLGVLAAAAPALAQVNLPDSQVEANVLRALAAAPELASESITTQTVYGTVTLSGAVTSEAARTKAENLAANAKGVQKVIDQLTLTLVPTPVPEAGRVLLSDGTYGPVPAEPVQRNDAETDQPPIPQPTAGAADNQPSAAAQTQPRLQPRTPHPNNGYPQQPPPNYAQPYQPPAYGAQVAGQLVIIPTDALVRVRLNRGLRSDNAQPGTPFDGTVVNDVVAGGFIAIPRGATVQGRVVEARRSGALHGRGELSIQLSSVTLAGKSYPLTSDLWTHNGGDKTIESINKTAIGGGVGALFGAVAAGGTGAAVGAGLGAALGLGSAAASGNGQVVLPPESIVTFHTAAEAQVATVSEQEMQRLAYGVPYSAEQPPIRRSYRVYPGYYPPPVYYSPYPRYPYPVY
jgi:hypothetical protein